LKDDEEMRTECVVDEWNPNNPRAVNILLVFCRVLEARGKKKNQVPKLGETVVDEWKT
jgi:hypothetical protein